MNPNDPAQIRLRAVEPTDADFMYEIENDMSAWRYSDTVAPISRKILRQYALDYDADPFSARQLRSIITVLQDGSWLPGGTVDLYEIDPIHRRAFVGIYLLPAFRNKGVAASALSAIAHFALNVLNLRMLAARIESSNHKSLRLFERCGYRTTATIPGWFISPDGATTALILMTLPLS